MHGGVASQHIEDLLLDDVAGVQDHVGIAHEVEHRVGQILGTVGSPVGVGQHGDTQGRSRGGHGTNRTHPSPG